MTLVIDITVPALAALVGAALAAGFILGFIVGAAWGWPRGTGY